MSHLPVKRRLFILIIFILGGIRFMTIYGQDSIRFDFCDVTVSFPYQKSSVVDFTSPLSHESINSFYNALSLTNYSPIVNSILEYKNEHNLDDWLYYQL